MNLTNDSVERVRSASIVQVLSSYISLKHKGASHEGCCPFHNEKTPSFKVSEAKGIYKCFGCGESGDVIRFVMNHEKLSFIDACKKIADISGVQLEFEEPADKATWEKKKSAIEQQEAVLDYVVPIYKKKLLDLPEDHPVKTYLAGRGITEDQILEWNLGWAGEDWHFITPQLINRNMFDPAAKLGIIRRAKVEGKNYDGYRSRIIIPITDRVGRFIGLAGRFIEVSPDDKGKDYPKYINPAECEIYNKSSVLFGLDRAAKAIKEKRFAYVVEGYMDLITPFNHGIENVVATCGTAFTSQQIQLLKKYTQHVAIWRDNDQAGKSSFAKSIEALLSEDFRVETVQYDGKDPDEFVLNQGDEVKEPVRKDGVIARAHELNADAGDDLHAKARVKQYVLQLLSNINNDLIREQYLEHLCKEFSWKVTDTKKQLLKLVEEKSETKELADDPDGVKLPTWVTNEQREAFLENGFIPVSRKVDGKQIIGYYSFSSAGKSQITNFLVDPLFHVYAGQESRYLLRINNGKRSAVLDVPAKMIPSPDQFQSISVSEGNFMIFGSANQWKRIASELLENFPRCIELTSLGWQTFSFFAYVDRVYVPGEGLKMLDNFGIVNHKGENFLIPASCEAYRQLQRTGEDPYENDRYLTYKESPVRFEEWAKQMNRVYPNRQGLVAIAFSILTMFRDIIFEVDNNCPHLYAYGEPSSGKSKWAESITALFYFKRPAFNVNSGTDFAFFNYMQRYINCPAHLNEVEIETIKPEWFQAIKGAFDGEGRERGKGGSKNKTEIMRVRSTLILTGQKLITADDNSVVTRSIIEPFSVRDNMTEDDRKAYEKLKEWELIGLNSILVELLAHRAYFQSHYKERLNNQLSEWRLKKQEARQLNQRILQNYAHLATCYAMIADHINLPETKEEFIEYCFEKAITWSQFIRNSDTLAEFWRTLEFLVDSKQVNSGWDYLIEESVSVRIRKGNKEEVDVALDAPTKVLYLRLNNVHKLFQSAFRSRTGKEAMNIETLLHYLSSRRYYLGPVKSKTFKRFTGSDELVTQPGNGLTPASQRIEYQKKLEVQKSSCYAFRYDELNLNIEREDTVMTGGAPLPEALGENENFSPIPTPDPELPF